jgi:hypothetical protein
MQALEMTADISNHRLVVEDATLPLHAEQARVIVLWNAPPASNTRRMLPPALAGLGREKGDILSAAPKL